MTRTINQSSFIDDNADVGMIHWIFDEHTEKHLSLTDDSLIETIGDLMHEHFESSFSNVIEQIQGLILGTDPSEDGEIAIVTTVELEAESFGSLIWTPGESTKFWLDSLAARDSEGYLHAMVEVTEFLANTMAVLSIHLCMMKQIDDHCMLTLLGQDISSN